VIIADREQAIHYVLQNAVVKDMILIAGKGHEDYQEIGDQRFPFSDRAIVASIMERILT
jgi:UDP-N-acetylmuramoyl-L-alanyl-D-glutamate--2,6-diaminopimelate ligase